MHYVLIRKKRNKRKYLRVKDGQVIVTAPYYESKKSIDEFVNANVDWIEKQLHLQDQTLLKDGDCIHLLTGNYILHIVPDLKRISIKENQIYVRNQKDFEKILKKASEQVLPDLFKNIQNQLRIQDMVLKIGVYSSQWGSCNKRKREIHLNAYLMMTDYSFVQSVIVHEFAHMYVSNHSSDFYKVVYTWMPEYDKVQKKYKHFRFPKLEQ